MRVTAAFSSLCLAASSLAASQLPFSSPPSTFPTPPSSFSPVTITRSIELGGSLTRSTTTYALTSNGVPGSEWVVSVLGQEGFVEAWETRPGQGKKPIALTKLGRPNGKATLYAVTLSSSKSDKATITLASTTSHESTPKPASLPQTAESISMYWSEDLLDILAGLTDDEIEKVEELRFKIKTPTPRILEIDAPKSFALAHSKGGTTITLTSEGSLVGVGPQVAGILYQQPDAVTTIRKLDRLVEVSHWGNNLAVMDDINLVNTGPELQGHFSRLDHQKNTMQRRSAASSINKLSIVLPPNIHSPYYYDVVGNVSTSRFRPSASPPSDRVTLPSQRKKTAKNAQNSLLELVPRYPLMGGWNFTFTIGYDAPLGDYVKRKGSGEYMLAVPFLTPIPEVAVDFVTLSIRLPEAARKIRVHTPFPVDSLSFPTEAPSLFVTSQPGYFKTYLDSTGRPTIVITKANCNDRHGGSIIIEYSASPLLDLLQKPLAVGLVLSSIFLSTMGIRRLEWSIRSK